MVNRLLTKRLKIEVKLKKTILAFHKAFTLIEMLFVILILSIVVANITHRQAIRQQEVLVNRAASDMTSLVPALVNYYLYHPQRGKSQLANAYQWPASLASLTITEQGAGLIPKSALCSPFLSVSLTNSDCDNYSPYLITTSINPPGSNPPTILPGNSTYLILQVDTGSKEYANQLAQKLSNAWISNNTVVNTAIPVPIQSSTANRRGFLASGGLVSTTGTLGSSLPYNPQTKTFSPVQLNIGSAIVLPNCPEGYEGHYIVAPTYYETYALNLLEGSSSGSGGGFTFPVSGIHLTFLAQTTGQGSSNGPWYDDPSASTTIVYPAGSDQYNHQAYAVTLGDVPVIATDGPVSNITPSSPYLIRHEVSYLTFCLPTGNWNTNYAPADNQPDAQCSPSWVIYERLTNNNQYYNGPMSNSEPYPCAFMDNQPFQPLAIGTATAY